MNNISEMKQDIEKPECKRLMSCLFCGGQEGCIMDKENRIRNIKKLHTTIKKRQYPPRMERDKAMVLYALERRIFAINGVNHGFCSEPQV